MKEAVHILATVRNPALLDATRLVFKTLRVGFPDNRVEVTGNGLEWFAVKEVEACCNQANANFIHGWSARQRVSHDEWVENLITTKSEPFWICDTDVVFFGSVGVSEFRGTGAMMGELEPEFNEEWTGTVHVERLHTAVMWIDPVQVRMAMRAWMSRIPLPWGASAQMNLIRQMFVPARDGGHTLFYDTCAGLWQAGIGRPLPAEVCAAWEHLHCGTYADEVSSQAPSLRDMQKIHRAIYADPTRARGLRAKQQQYYKGRGKELINAI